MNLDTLVSVKNLHKHYPQKRKKMLRAVDGISFSIGRKEILGIVGESGCGKSTMGRSIIRLIEPTAGEIYIGNQDIAGLNKKELKAARRSMQMIFQDPFGALNPRRSVYDIISQSIHTHSLAASKEEETDMIRHALADVGLNPPELFMAKYPASMSGGQLQRVSMARVLVLKPEFIIADEPVSMLDVSVRIGILQLLHEIRDTYGISFLYITHDLSTARYICDRIAIMYLGAFMEIGPTESILHNPLHPYTKALITAVPCTNPSLRKERVPIRGFVPVDFEETAGRCRFADRCPESFNTCFQKEPESIEYTEGHRVSCHLYAKPGI